MKKFLITIFALLLILSPSIAYASDITNYKYKGTIRVSNNSTSLQTASSTIITGANTTNLINGGYLNSSANNCAIQYSGTDVPFMPGYGPVPWSVFVPSISANSYLSDILYTNAIDGKIRYFTGTTGLVVTDAAGLEPGDNFTLSLTDVYLKDSGNISDKGTAFTLDYNDESDTISFGISIFEDIIRLTPSANSTIGIKSATGNHYSDVDDPPGSPDDAGTYVHTTNSTAFEYDIYDLTAPGWTASNVMKIQQVNLIYRFAGSGGNSTCYARAGLVLSGSNQTAVPLLTTSSSFATVNQTISRPGGGNWAASDFDNLQLQVGIKAAGGTPLLTQAYVEISFINSMARATANAVSDGEYDINVTALPIMNFNGTSSLAVINNYTALNFGTGDFTVLAAFSTNQTSTNNVGLYDKVQLIGSDYYGYALHIHNKKLTLTMPDGDPTIPTYSGNTDVNDNNFHIGGISVIRGDKAYIYLDGSADGTPSLAANTATVTNTTNIQLGKSSQYNKYYSGNMSSVAVYNRALTAAEMILATEYGYYPSSGLVGLWEMDETTGITIYNSVSGGNNGTLTDIIRHVPGVLRIDIDGTVAARTNVISIPNTSANWTIGNQNTTPYFNTINMSVDGIPVLGVGWSYASNLVDTVGGHSLTASFRTTSSNSNVSAELISFSPASEAKAPEYTVSDAEDFITSTPTISANLSTNITSPFAPVQVIIDASNSGNTPPQLPIMILSMVGVLTLSWVVTYLTRRFGSSSMLPKLIIVLCIIGIMVPIGIYDFWMVIYISMMGVAFAMAKTHSTWGGETGYNMFGFLAMAFVGMTIINRFMEGAFINSTDVSILNNILVFRPINVLGLFTISVPNLSFLTSGIPALIRWDYSFFGGNAIIIQYLLYSITAVVAIILFVWMLGAIFNILSRARI